MGRTSPAASINVPQLRGRLQIRMWSRGSEVKTMIERHNRAISARGRQPRHLAVLHEPWGARVVDLIHPLTPLLPFLSLLSRYATYGELQLWCASVSKRSKM